MLAFSKKIYKRILTQCSKRYGFREPLKLNLEEVSYLNEKGDITIEAVSPEILLLKEDFKTNPHLWTLEPENLDYKLLVREGGISFLVAKSFTRKNMNLQFTYGSWKTPIRKGIILHKSLKGYERTVIFSIADSVFERMKSSEDDLFRNQIKNILDNAT